MGILSFLIRSFIKYSQNSLDPDTSVRVYNEIESFIQEAKSMKIGELAARTGVSIRSLRYYEQQGLLMPVRNENGYREYSILAEEQVRTIQLYLNLGLSTEQIAGFLHCVLKNKEAFCAEVFPIFRQNCRDRCANPPAEPYQDESGGTHAIDSGGTRIGRSGGMQMSLPRIDLTSFQARLNRMELRWLNLEPNGVRRAKCRSHSGRAEPGRSGSPGGLSGGL